MSDQRDGLPREDAAGCPAPSLLLQFVRGVLPASDRSWIGAHLDACDECGARLAALDDPDDPLIRFLRENNMLVPDPRAIDLAEDPSGESTSDFVGEEAGTGGGDAGRASRRYATNRFHDRGGLGEVWVARDRHLDREVAVKRLRRDRSFGPEIEARFLREAEITGRLEHPGIVPVHDIGHDLDGRPYYVMRFVRGETLRAAANRLHGRSEDNQADPVGRELELRRLITRFVTVCNTVAYAHSRGVIHRDLKPANILLGPYGETLVVDWGLAKVVAGAGDKAAEGMPPPNGSEEDRFHTAEGQALGTPLFMSPEQASGRIDQIGPRSDIYSLGATLYYVLTGTFPHDAKLSRSELSRQVVEGTFTPPRAIDPSIPPALEAVCLKAMNREPARRYATAIELAEDLDRWLADQPVSAWREPWADRARRWARRNRTAVMSSVVGVLIVAIGLSVATPWLLLLNQRFVLQRRKAEDRELLAIEAVGQFRDAVQKNPLLLGRREFEPLRKALLRGPHSFFRSLRDRLETDRDTRPESFARLARAHFELALTTADVDKVDTALRTYHDAIAILERLVRDNPRDVLGWSNLSHCLNNVGILHSDAGRTDDALASYGRALAIREWLVRVRPGVVEHRNNLAASLENLGVVYRETGRLDDSLKTFEKARSIREALDRDHPDSIENRMGLAKNWNNVGILHRDAGKTKEAIDSYDRAIAVQERVVRDRPDDPEVRADLAASLVNLGLMRRDMGLPREALRAYGRALEILERLARDHYAVVEYRLKLADALHNTGLLHEFMGRPAEALASQQRTLETYESLARERPGVTAYHLGVASCLNNIAGILQGDGRNDEAMAACARALETCERLARDHPRLTEPRRGLAQTLGNQAILQKNDGKVDEARRSYARALTIWEGLARDEPHVAGYRNSLAEVHYGVGLLMVAANRPEEALRSFERASPIWTRLAREAPGVVEHRSNLAGCLNNIGNLQRTLGRPSESLRSHGIARRIRERLARDHPDVPEHRADLALSEINIGVLHADAHDLEQAVRSHERALAIYDDLAREHPEAVEYRSGQADALHSLGKFLDDLGRPDESMNAYRRAAKVFERLARERPDVVEYRRGLAETWNDLGALSTTVVTNCRAG